MSNPARELIAIIEEWHSREVGTARAVRGVDKPGEARRHVRAMKCLWEMQLWLEMRDESGDETEAYWAAWNNTVRVVAVFPTGWNNSESKKTQFVPRPTLATLRLMARDMDNLPELYITHVDLYQSLREWVEEVLTLVEEDDALPSALRETLERISHEILRGLSGETRLDAMQLRDSLRWLWVSVHEASNCETPKRKSWRASADRSVSFASGVLSNGAYDGLLRIGQRILES